LDFTVFFDEKVFVSESWMKVMFRVRGKRRKKKFQCSKTKITTHLPQDAPVD
jgi:hypothetical protein